MIQVIQVIQVKELRICHRGSGYEFSTGNYLTGTQRTSGMSKLFNPYVVLLFWGIDIYVGFVVQRTVHSFDGLRYYSTRRCTNENA